MGARKRAISGSERAEKEEKEDKDCEFQLYQVSGGIIQNIKGAE